MIVGEFIADFCESAEGDLDIPTALIREAVEAERARLDVLLHGGGTERADAHQDRDAADHDRQGRHLPHGRRPRGGRAPLQGLVVRSRKIGLRHKADGPNPELVTAYRTQKMLEDRALHGDRSARAHRKPRRAFPRGLPARATMPAWLRRTLAMWAEPRATLPCLTYEPLDVMAMELPPGWRGYGAKNYVDHPDTPAARRGTRWLREQMKDADRHRGAARGHALRAPAARAFPRPQRTHRRAAAMTDRPATTATAPRKLRFHVLRHDPRDPQSVRARRAVRARGSGRHDIVHRIERDPRAARSLAGVRFRLPRRHLRQLRHGRQRPAGPRLPHAHARTCRPTSRSRRCRPSS